MATSRFTRAVVTGGCGFIGSHLCEFLLARGVQVVCLDNLLTGQAANVSHLLSHPGFTFTRCDVSERVEVNGHVDLVLHFASPAAPRDYLAHPIETMNVGSLGTFNALDLARRCDARFVLASTSETYGDPEVHPQPEDYWGHVNPVGPRSVYDEAKRFAEAATVAYRTTFDVDAAVVRLFNTFGPRMRPNDGRVIPTFIRQALAGQPLTVCGDGSQTRSLCFIDDLVRGVMAVAGSTMAGPVNIGSADELTVLDLARRIISLTGSNSPITFVALPEDDPRKRRPDVRLIESTLDWHAYVPLPVGIERTVEWFAAQTAA